MHADLYVTLHWLQANQKAALSLIPQLPEQGEKGNVLAGAVLEHHSTSLVLDVTENACITKSPVHMQAPAKIFHFDKKHFPPIVTLHAGPKSLKFCSLIGR